MRKKLAIPLQYPWQFKLQLLFWSKQFEYVCILDSHDSCQKKNSKAEYNTYELLAGIDALEIIAPAKKSFEHLKTKLDHAHDWWFGHLSYELKNEIENLQSKNKDFIKFPNMCFFRPRWVFEMQKDELFVHYFEDEFNEKEISALVKQLQNSSIPQTQNIGIKNISAEISKEEYLNSVLQLKEHIRKGDIYEVNFCQEFYVENCKINPHEVYQKLVQVSPTPYACFYAAKQNYLLSASPERFLKKQGNKLIAQPIKGTAVRAENKTDNEKIKANLFKDPKERAENLMIVDLVRNDLSKTAKKSSVAVEELCGIYSFPQVHQMISTIVAELKEGVHPVESIRQSFPMGSMTGAPKIRAMELIEQYESTKRGLFSGAVGYFSPQGNFDFNVVIRSLLYNKKNRYLSFMVGSAITILAKADKEYEECLLKIKAIMSILNSSHESPGI